MSSISSTSGDSGLYQFLRQVAGQQASAPQTPQTGGVQGADSDGDSDASSEAQGAGRAHGHHGHHGGGLFKKIEAAVTSALQDSSNDPSADPNKVIQDAIAKVLKDGPGGQPPADGSTPPPGAGDPSAQGANASSSREAFQSLLKSFGVDDSQFRADFLAALKQVKGGSDASLAETIPPGSAVDTVA
ncbi:MAG: hypothetical protein NTW19_12260 [Planctomycetota bacterium]|nr:hypothetical protein [Planctomycetota bacterium]